MNKKGTKVRKVGKRKKPKFPRQHAHSKARVSKCWRKPRGQDSKQRKKIRSRGARPTVGYRQPRKIRGLHPSGFREILIHNVDDLKKIDLEKNAVRIAGRVGKKKKNEIIKKADEMKLKVLNR